MPKQQRKDYEKLFEDHFCHQLDTKWGYRIFRDSEITVDKENCIHWDRLEQFWEDTQRPSLQAVKSELSYDWKKELGKKIAEQLQEKPLFQLLRDGLMVSSQHHLDLVYFKPERADNREQENLYKKNVFSIVRQYHFTSSANARQQEDDRQSIDIVVCLNGFAIITVELKHTLAGQNVNDAVEQYCDRDVERAIYNRAFVHIAADDEKAKIATTFSKPPVKEDFREFNTGIKNKKIKGDDYAVQYLYNEILKPDNVLNYIDRYLFGSIDKWIFPRYHQQRCVTKIYDDIIREFKKNKTLNLKYLVQHSAGSGKSNTIVWLVQNLRNLHIKNAKLFDHIIILTHRINLDDQISKDFIKAIGQMGIVAYCKTSNDVKLALGQRLNKYRNPEIPINAPVIVTILHKFSFIKEISDQSSKKICFIIDEAHTNQEGKLHEKMVNIFDNDAGKFVNDEILDEQDELLAKISEKEFSNLCFIALTATPSENTIQHFGMEGKATDVYSMDEAIAEGYILDVAKNIIPYETLYKLDYEFAKESKRREYPSLQVHRALKLKAYEEDNLIKEKCRIILQIFKDQTANKIEGKAKSMVVTSSRLCAVKYKLFLDEELQKHKLKWKTLVAYTGKTKYNNIFFTEVEMNKPNNPLSVKIEDCFKENDDIRFLIVANKFQVGFNEKMLHTMFLDKPLRGRNAVQTISRLNRIFPGKKFDTLTVDFTNSYDEIIKAFKLYQSKVESNKKINPKDLYKLKDALLKMGIFTLKDVEDCKNYFLSEKASDLAPLSALLTGLKEVYLDKYKDNDRSKFKTLLLRYIKLYSLVRVFYNIAYRELILNDFYIFADLLYKKLDPSMNPDDLEEEIKKVTVKSFAVIDISDKLSDKGIGGGSNDGGSNDGGSIIGGNGGEIDEVYSRPMSTVEEVVEAINLKFKEKISPEGVSVIDDYLQDLTNDEEIKSTIKNNLEQDEKQVYDLVIKDILNRKYSDYILNNSVVSYEELTQNNIQSYVNISAYRMLRELVRASV